MPQPIGSVLRNMRIEQFRITCIRPARELSLQPVNEDCHFYRGEGEFASMLPNDVIKPPEGVLVIASFPIGAELE